MEAKLKDHGRGMEETFIIWSWPASTFKATQDADLDFGPELFQDSDLVPSAELPQDVDLVLSP